MDTYSEESAAVIRRLWDEVFVQKKFDVADEILAPDYVLYDYVTTPGAEVRGAAGMRNVVEEFDTFYRDLEIRIEELAVVEEGWVETRHTLTGTDKDKGIRVSVDGISISFVSGGKIRKSWVIWDVFSLLQQKGQEGTGRRDDPGTLDPGVAPEALAGRWIGHWW